MAFFLFFLSYVLILSKSQTFTALGGQVLSWDEAKLACENAGYQFATFDDITQLLDGAEACYNSFANDNYPGFSCWVGFRNENFDDTQRKASVF